MSAPIHITKLSDKESAAIFVSQTRGRPSLSTVTTKRITGLNKYSKKQYTRFAKIQQHIITTNRFGEYYAIEYNVKNKKWYTQNHILAGSADTYNLLKEHVPGRFPQYEMRNLYKTYWEETPIFAYADNWHDHTVQLFGKQRAAKGLTELLEAASSTNATNLTLMFKGLVSDAALFDGLSEHIDAFDSQRNYEILSSKLAGLYRKRYIIELRKGNSSASFETRYWNWLYRTIYGSR